MRINFEHLYHGAALNQIAEDQHFTAINAFKANGHVSRSAFRVNDDIGVYLKYCSEPKGAFDEYKFTFNGEHLQELRSLAEKCDRVFLALVCVKDGHVCCLPYAAFQRLLGLRRASSGVEEATYQVLVVLPGEKEFRAYVNAPGVRRKMLGETKVPRNAFPSGLFA
jgi:hypothetical protein